MLLIVFFVAVVTDKSSIMQSFSCKQSQINIAKNKDGIVNDPDTAFKPISNMHTVAKKLQRRIVQRMDKILTTKQKKNTETILALTRMRSSTITNIIFKDFI